MESFKSLITILLLRGSRENSEFNLKALMEARDLMMRQTGVFEIWIDSSYANINGETKELIKEEIIYAILETFPERFEILSEETLDEVGLEKVIKIRRIRPDEIKYQFDADYDFFDYL